MREMEGGSRVLELAGSTLVVTTVSFVVSGLGGIVGMIVVMGLGLVVLGFGNVVTTCRVVEFLMASVVVLVGSIVTRVVRIGVDFALVGSGVVLVGKRVGIVVSSVRIVVGRVGINVTVVEFMTGIVGLVGLSLVGGSVSEVDRMVGAVEGRSEEPVGVVGFRLRYRKLTKLNI